MEEPIQYFTAEGVGTTVVHPLGVLMLAACGLLLIVLPRRYALWPFIVLICFVSSRQCIAIAGLNLYFARVMVLVCGLARLLFRGELRELRLNTLDWTVMAYGIVYLLSGALNWGLDLSVIKTRSGYLVEVVGIYLLMRVLIRDLADLHGIVLCLAIMAVAVAGCFVVEFATGRNMFAVFGGVPELTEVRDGRLRCQGAFAHPILAGVIWASFVPVLLYGALSIQRHRPMIIAGACAAVGIVILTASSTPVLGVAVVIAGICTYRVRTYSRHAFATLGITLVALHVIMKAPVWSLIQRINITSGNSGHHRYLVVDGFIRHWSEWWLLGSTVGTAHWGHFTFDTANQYVAAGTAAGLPGLGLFIAIIVLALFGAGRIGRWNPKLGWALGVTVMVHAICFLGISIWGQLHFAWNLPLAIIGSLGCQAGVGSRVPVSGRRQRHRPLRCGEPSSQGSIAIGAGHNARA